MALPIRPSSQDLALLGNTIASHVSDASRRGCSAECVAINAIDQFEEGEIAFETKKLERGVQPDGGHTDPARNGSSLPVLPRSSVPRWGPMTRTVRVGGLTSFGDSESRPPPASSIPSVTVQDEERASSVSNRTWYRYRMGILGHLTRRRRLSRKQEPVAITLPYLYDPD